MEFVDDTSMIVRNNQHMDASSIDKFCLASSYWNKSQSLWTSAQEDTPETKILFGFLEAHPQDIWAFRLALMCPHLKS